MKVDKTVKKETLYIAALSGVLSLLMQAVFLVIGQWHFSVFLGNLWGYAAAVGNFFLMGLTVQKAVLKDEEEAKKTGTRPALKPFKISSLSLPQLTALRSARPFLLSAEDITITNITREIA